MYKKYYTDKRFLISIVSSLVLLLVSLVVNYYAGLYASVRASNPVTDLILSNIPVFDIDGIFIYGALWFWVLTSLLGFIRPQWFPFSIKSIALFTLIRSVFVSLTHIGPFPNQIIISPLSIMHKFSSGSDLFFSAHTGLPFLMALIFWDHRNLRVFFLVCSVIFGVTVLLGHLHYSIDVLSAFFITYSIYHIARVVFKRDYEVFQNGLRSDA